MKKFDKKSHKISKSKKINLLSKIASDIRGKIFTKQESKIYNRLFKDKNFQYFQNMENFPRGIRLQSSLSVDLYINLSSPISFILDKEIQKGLNKVLNFLFMLKKINRLLSNSLFFNKRVFENM